MKTPAHPVRSSLAGLVSSGPSSPEEIEQLRQRCWSQYGIAVIPVSELNDDWDRLHVTGIANRLYGKRKP